MRVVLASNNAAKLAELATLLDGLGLALVAQGALGIAEADEPHFTFVENALAKARHAAAACGGPALADDSGLCVDALAGAPGVASAHYAAMPDPVRSAAASAAGSVDAAVPVAGPVDGSRSTGPSAGLASTAGVLAGPDREALRRRQDAANNARLLAGMAGVADRRARYVATLVAVRRADDPEPLVAVGRWHGSIVHEPRGSGGFGYDALLHIDALGCTVAELDAARKNRHSHRARAARLLRRLVREAWLP